MQPLYDKNSIETLPFREAVRLRIPMYLGSEDMEGVYNSIQEIVSNAIDEYIMGYGTEITITLEKDGYISVNDFGRGVPFGMKADGVNTLEDIYSKAHTGGKFNDKAYQFAVGLNGIGAKATCLSSEVFEVITIQRGKQAMARFEQGVMVKYLEEDAPKDKSDGTMVRFLPDAEVFNLEPIVIDFQRLCTQYKSLSYLTQGLKFILINEATGDKVVYESKNGLTDMVKDMAREPIHPHPITHSIDDGDNKIEIALQWTKGKEKSLCFTNGVLNVEGGQPITGIKTAITRNINQKFNGGLTGDLARTGLIYVVSCKVAHPSFANQTKTKINNPELRSLADRAFTEAFNQFVLLNPAGAKKIEDFLIKEKKAEEAAERARQKILREDKAIQEERKSKVGLNGKLSDSKYHDERSSFFICEGDSAKGSVDGARDSDFVATFAIRGKIINALKNPIDEVLDNEEVKNIIRALGCGIQEKCNPKKMRYGKVVFAADADPDGYSIVCLLLTLFYVLMPQLIEEGRVYWLQMPLYEIEVGSKTYFAYDDDELMRAPKGKVNRNKGLGEMDEDVFAEAAFGENARSIQFTMDDAAGAMEMMDILLGKNNKARKEYIFNNLDFTGVEE